MGYSGRHAAKSPLLRHLTTRSRRGLAAGAAGVVMVATTVIVVSSVVGGCGTSAAPALALVAATPRTPIAAAAGSGVPTASSTDGAVPVHPPPPVRTPVRSETDEMVPYRIERTNRPRPASAWVPVAGVETRVGDLPVTLTGVSSVRPTSVRVEVLDDRTREAAGVSGALLRLSCADGVTAAATVRLRVSYWDFAQVYGGDYANRVGLVRLPTCALTDPAQRECLRRRTRLDAERRDAALSADVTVPAGDEHVLVGVT
ncbi:hypothetical protein [Micromonospora globispora]|uniref:hypothetical protein n=1 Tax=Micromonospora globispora TaxID=1450148 RepID=UPI000F5DF12E|nr:hypothetical protein [Micromonospora globispora]